MAYDTTLSATPFGPAVSRRGLRIVAQVQEKLTAAPWAGKDISAARWTYRVRAWSADTATAFVFNEVLSESSTAATTGWLDHYLALGTSARDTLTWEIVELDTDNADTSTHSGKRETVLMRWRQAVLEAPV